MGWGEPSTPEPRAVVARRLRDRAESYGRDMAVLQANDDPSWSSYMTVRDELREIAAEIEAT